MAIAVRDDIAALKSFGDYHALELPSFLKECDEVVEGRSLAHEARRHVEQLHSPLVYDRQFAIGTDEN